MHQWTIACGLPRVRLLVDRGPHKLASLDNRPTSRIGGGPYLGPDPAGAEKSGAQGYDDTAGAFFSLHHIRHHVLRASRFPDGSFTHASCRAVHARQRRRAGSRGPVQ